MSAPVHARDLRNHYGDLLRRVQAGESIDIIKDGTTIATIGPPRLPRGVSGARLREFYARAEPLDEQQFRADLDLAVDQRLERE